MPPLAQSEIPRAAPDPIVAGELLPIADSPLVGTLMASERQLVGSDCDGPDEALSARQERFIKLYVEGSSAAAAYRSAYSVALDAPKSRVHTEAYRLLHSPKVEHRVRQLQAEAAERTIINVRARMARLELLCAADPSELTRTVVSNCRHCHGGAGFARQWRDANEWACACAQAIEAGKAPPSFDGGEGYSADREPHPRCPRCDGHGITRIVITPNEELSPAGRALFRGVKTKSDGSIEVLMHDQLAAADMLNKMQAAYLSTSLNVSVPAPATVSASPDALLQAFNSMRKSVTHDHQS